MGGAAKPAQYPVGPVLDGVAEVCRNLETVEGTTDIATKAGWEIVTAAPGTDAAKVIALITSERSNLVKKNGGELLPVVTLRRTIFGEDLLLILSGAKVAGNLAFGCFAYDLGETRKIDAGSLKAWMKWEPDQILDDPAMQGWTWKPGIDPAHRSFVALFIPERSPAINAMGMNGVVFKADAIRKLN